MKLRAQTWIVLGGGLALLVFTASFAWREHQWNASVDRNLATTERKRDALRHEVEKFEAQLRQRRASPVAAAPVTPDSAASAPAAEEPPITPATMAALRVESGKAEARGYYAPFLAQRGFTLEKIAAFADRLALNQEQKGALATEWPGNAKDASNDGARQSFRTRQQELEKSFLADMESFLGPEDFARFRQYREELRFWTSVQTFAGRLHDTDTPLTPAQASQLESVFVAQATDATGKVGHDVADWDGVFARAAGFLSPAQLTVLKAQRDYDETWRQLNQLSGQVRTAAAKAAATSK